MKCSNEKLRYYKSHDNTLSSPTVTTSLGQIHEDFIEVPTNKATNNVALTCERFYASVMTKELGFSSKTRTFKEINNLSSRCRYEY